MDTSELYLLLKSLTINELDHFSNLIQQESWGKGRYRQQVKKLFDLIKNHIQSGESTPLDKEMVFQDLFPEQSVSLAQVERVMHELLLLVRQFLLTEHYFSEALTLERQIHLVSIMRIKGLENKALNHLNQTLKEISEMPFKGTTHLKTGFEGAYLHYSISSQNTKWKDDLQITSALHYLDLYYMSQKLQLVNHFLILNAISKMNNEVSDHTIDTTIQINPAYLDSEPYLNILYKTYLLLTNPNPAVEGFEELTTLLQEHENHMDQDALRIQYGYLRNYCSFLIWAGYRYMWPVLNKINKDNLNKGYFLYNGKIPLGSFSSIASVAIRSGEPDWAYEFANQYKDLTHGNPEDASETYNLIIAQYYHYKKNYKEALSYLPQVSQSLIRSLLIKALEIKIYYDKGDELFSYKLDAFKMFISRSSKKLISEEARERNSNFVNFLIQISNTARADRERLEKIRTRIQERAKVVEKEWLLDKIEELMS